MAPTESRFADSPNSTRSMTAKNSAKGMVAETTIALRRLPRNNHWTAENENDPEGEVGEHLFGRQPDQFGTIIDAFEMHTGRQDSRSIDLVHLRFDAADGRRGLLAAAHQHNALHDVVVVVLAGDAEARREALLDVGDIAHEGWRLRPTSTRSCCEWRPWIG